MWNRCTKLGKLIQTAYTRLVIRGRLQTTSQLLLQSWNAFFINVSRGVTPGEAYQPPPTSSAYPSNVGNAVSEHLAIQALIRAYQVTAVV